jgi:predicted DNA-binding transcriptional regulator AlpA
MYEIMYAEEVSAMARIPLATLYYYRSTGMGPKSGKLGRRVVYRRADVEAWIAEAFA